MVPILPAVCFESQDNKARYVTSKTKSVFQIYREAYRIYPM